MFFLIGWWYREDAIQWMQANYPAAAKSWDKAEDSFRHASYAAVVVEPGMIVCDPSSVCILCPCIFRLPLERSNLRPPIDSVASLTTTQQVLARGCCAVEDQAERRSVSSWLRAGGQSDTGRSLRTL